MRDLQLESLRGLIRKILAGDSYYAPLLREAGVDAEVGSLDDFVNRMPFTTKADLVADQITHPPFGSNLTEPIENYTRFCQTSGTTTGKPISVVDTPESWEAMLECWRKVYRAAQLEPGKDRIFFAFSFGPFLGFWTAFEAAADRFLALPGGGLSSGARLEAIERNSATVLCCTPTYAIRLGEVLDGAATGVRKIIVAGEPGGSLPSVRKRISRLWSGAEIFDHHGLTEVGPVSYEHPERPGDLSIVDEAYFAEVIDPESGQAAKPGAEGELVLTTLGRTASPLLRYRTGDLVLPEWSNEGRLILQGGILGRCDDMVVVRGVNVYPSAIEEVVCGFTEVAEFQVVRRTREAMDELEVRVEWSGDALPVKALESALRDRFALRIPVTVAKAGSLPRFEFKSARWVEEKAS